MRDRECTQFIAKDADKLFRTLAEYRRRLTAACIALGHTEKACEEEEKVEPPSPDLDDSEDEEPEHGDVQ